MKLTERNLVYCYVRCPCGALYAYCPGDPNRSWDCSDIILHKAIQSGHPGSVTHGDRMPFMFWKVKEAPLEWALKYRFERAV